MFLSPPLISSPSPSSPWLVSSLKAHTLHSPQALPPAWSILPSSIWLPPQPFYHNCPPLQHPIHYLPLWVPLLSRWCRPWHQQSLQLSSSLPSLRPSLLPELPPILLNWLHSYLLNRSQSVVLNCISSAPKIVSLGVPQIQFWGPSSLYYTSNLPLSSNSSLILYTLTICSSISP